MENAEEILQCLDEFSKLRPKEIPPELEYYLSFVARTGDPVYQWPLIKCLFREKLLNVITEFYEACPSVEIPPCPNVEIFNYEAMKGFILEKLDTFAAAPFTVQRICELLTSPRKEYNRIDKYMRALEKNILVVSTREPGNRKSTENGESVVNGLESEHGSQEMVNSLNSDINVEVDMDEKTVWHKSYAVNESNIILESRVTDAEAEADADTDTDVDTNTVTNTAEIQESYVSESKTSSSCAPTTTTVAESVITARQINYIGYTNEMLVEPSTTISNSEEVVATTPQPENSGVPTVFGLAARSTDNTKEEQVYVAEDSAFIKADCSDIEMDTSQIISETETEPITPPEPEETPPHPDKAEHQQQQQQQQPESSVVEALVESTTTATITTTTTEAEEEVEREKQIESSSNETRISSSDEMAQTSREETHPPEAEAAAAAAEITASDHQEVTESNIVIGPEDMQVEDISPEPEAEAEAEAKVTATPTITETEAPQLEAEVEVEAKQPVDIEPPAESKAPENLEAEKKPEPEVINVEIESNTKTEEISLREEKEEAPQNLKENEKEDVESTQIQIQTQTQTETQEIVKVVTESSN